jgi:hypothetical protein
MHILTRPFNSDPAIEALVKTLHAEFQFERFVETGTYHGFTTKWFAKTFPDKEIHTVESNKLSYDAAQRQLKEHTNIVSYFGDSPVVLKEILQTNKKTFFYLDAHWAEAWPLRQELEEIAGLCKDNCCIMIDDFKVPNRPFHFDTYKNQPLDLDYVMPGLQMIFTEPLVFFNGSSENPLRPVGKLICFPKSWTSNLAFKNEKDVLYF